MFFLDEDFRITRIAGSLADWLNHDHDDLVGEPITTITNSGDVSSLETALKRVQETRETQSIYCHFVVGGEVIPVDIELAPVGQESTLGKIVGTVHRESIPTDTQTSQLVDLRNFIELLNDPAVVYELVDTEPIVQAVNSGFVETFGFQPTYIVGDSLNDYIVPAEQQAEATRFDEQIADGEVATAVVRRRTSSGVQRFTYRGLPVDRDGDRKYGLAIYADMTDEEQAREHLQVLHRVLRHNVRNELTVILGMADQIADAAESEDISTAAKRIISRAEELSNVSDKARMAADILGDSPSDTVVDVGGMAADVVSDARTTWPDATIETDIESQVSVSTGFEIRDALENLVENAITHNTDSPTVRVTTRVETPIHASTRGSGKNAVITVEDNGPGIPEHEQAVIFEGADMTQLRHGSGLGLWVVRWIIESADGTVSYDRADGWTTITLRLPIAADFDGVNGQGQVNQDSP